jgi:hypothetical protein
VRDAGVEYALVDGFAITAHGFNRFSEDIDIRLLGADRAADAGIDTRRAAAQRTSAVRRRQAGL